MAKRKKISFRYYLNTSLKSLPIEGIDRYPVYLRITFNRRNTTSIFPLLYSDGYLSEKEFEQFFEKRINKEINKLIENYESQIEKAIRAEYKFWTEDGFKLSGIGKRYYRYSQPAMLIIEEQIKDEIIRYFEGQNALFVRGFFHSSYHIYDSWTLLENHFGLPLQEIIPGQLKKDIEIYFLLSSYFYQQADTESESLYFTGFDCLEVLESEKFNSFIVNGVYAVSVDSVDKVYSAWKSRFLADKYIAAEVSKIGKTLLLMGVQE